MRVRRQKETREKVVVENVEGKKRRNREKGDGKKTYLRACQHTDDQGKRERKRRVREEEGE